MPKNKYHRLRYDEMKKRKLLPGQGRCGYELETLIKETVEGLKLKSQCALTGQRCLYYGRVVHKDTDYNQCAVYTRYVAQCNRNGLGNKVSDC